MFLWLIVHLPPHLKLEFQPQNGWGEGVRCLETREALFAAEIAKLINSLGGGQMNKKGCGREGGGAGNMDKDPFSI